MKLLRRVLIGTTAFGLLSACTTTTPPEEMAPPPMATEAAPAEMSFDTGWPDTAEASAERMKTDLTTLASDAYEGREAGTAGYEKAVSYVTAAYEEIGLKPAGVEGYLQEVPLRRKTTVQETSMVEVGDAALTLFEDFIVSPHTYSQSVDVTAEVVFVGYGIDAPQFGQNVYETADVSGKIVAVLSGAPDDLPSEERAHFQSGSSKSAAAKAHGAVGMVTLNPDGGASGSRLERYATRPSEVVVHPDGAEKTLEASAYLTKAGTKKLAEAAGMKSSDLSPENAGKALGVSLHIKGETTWEDFSAPNVVGLIEGSDPELKDEYVVLTAHLDHIGKLRVIEPEEGQDIINNGAMDNASGISTLLEEARKFKMADTPPRRSVLFVALAAEEKGLLGSEYFAQHPTVPESAMVANVNLDMPILMHDFTDVIAFGAQHSTLKDVAEEATGSMGVTLSPDPVPQMVLFVRSDHYNFVKQGVPSVFLFLGFANGGEESFQKFMSTNYHRPGDDTTQAIMWDVAAKFAEVNYRIARTIADADEAPHWNEGDFFGDYFGK